jgi:hypothetical protein
MTQSLAPRMDEWAHFVAGLHPWTRDKNDSSVRRSLENANAFVEHVRSEIGWPHISGGTTNSPEDILTLYWQVKNINKIVGVYVTFKSDGTSEVRWNDSGNSTQKIKRMSIDDLIAFDVPRKFARIRNNVVRSRPTSEL